MDLVTIIVPVYNVEPYLERCLTSIINQSYKNLEIILVNDGSNDGSGEICRRYACQDQRIRLVEQKNQGLSAARNHGLDLMSGHYVCFVDSDDAIEKNMVEVLHRACVNNKVQIAVCGRYNVWPDRREQQFCNEKEEVLAAEQAITYLLTWNGMDSAAWDKMYDSSLYEGIRYPEGKLHEDLPVTYRLIMKAEKIVHVGRPLYNYTQRQSGITQSTFSYRTMDLYENARGMTEEIRKAYPQLSKECDYFMIHIRNSLIVKMISAIPRQPEYRPLFYSMRKEQRHCCRDILKCTYLTEASRVRNIENIFIPAFLLVLSKKVKQRWKKG